MHKNNREATFYDLKIVLPHRAGNSVSVKDLLEKLKGDVGSSFARLVDSSDGERILTLRDVEFSSDQKFAFLLISVADKGVGDAVFEDLDKGTLRNGGKLPTEAVGRSSHVVIKMDPKAKVSAYREGYRALIENVDGVGKSRIEGLINKMLQRHEVTINYGEEGISSPPKFSFNAHASAKLKSSSAGAIVEEIILLENEPVVKGIDVPLGAKIIPSRRVIKMGRSTLDEVTAILKKSFGSKEKNFDYVKVRVNAGGHRHTLNVNDEDQADLAERLLTEQVALSVSHDMDQCHKKIDKSLVDEMRKELGKKD